MSEFIVTSEQLERMVEAIEHNTSRKINRLVIDGVMQAEIVRCRDCRHYGIVDETYDCDPIYGCCFLYFKGKRIDDDMQEPQDENGFCAWGERRDE